MLQSIPNRWSTLLSRAPMCFYCSFYSYFFPFCLSTCYTMHQLCTTVPSPPPTDTVPLHIISRKHINNPLTSWNRDLFDLYLQLVKKFSTLYEARWSLLYLQEATTCPIPGTDHSTPRHPIPFL
jgi:hypothetical protein